MKILYLYYYPIFINNIKILLSNYYYPMDHNDGILKPNYFDHRYTNGMHYTVLILSREYYYSIFYYHKYHNDNGINQVYYPMCH